MNSRHTPDAFASLPDHTSRFQVLLCFPTTRSPWCGACRSTCPRSPEVWCGYWGKFSSPPRVAPWSCCVQLAPMIDYPVFKSSFRQAAPKLVRMEIEISIQFKHSNTYRNIFLTDSKVGTLFALFFHRLHHCLTLLFRFLQAPKM